MVRYGVGMIRYDMVVCWLYDMVWVQYVSYGMVWYGMVWCGYDMVLVVCWSVLVVCWFIVWYCILWYGKMVW